MKYLINESQIKKIVFEYFDSESYDVADDFNDLMLLNSDGLPLWAYTRDDRRLLVANDIISVVESAFSLRADDVLEYAGQWFEDNYGYIVDEIMNWDL